MILIGIDLAWSEKNPSGIAIGELSEDGTKFKIIDVKSLVLDKEKLLNDFVFKYSPEGIAIDAPCIAKNKKGSRDCEKKINSLFNYSDANCHSTNLDNLYVRHCLEISKMLYDNGYSYIENGKWQIECYPHASLVGMFNLKKIFKYKKELVSDKRYGQVKLAKSLKNILKIHGIEIDYSGIEIIFNENHINQLRGNDLKSNEDKIDSIICLFTALLHYLKLSEIIGDKENGFICIPKNDAYKYLEMINKEERIDVKDKIELFFNYFFKEMKGISLIKNLKINESLYRKILYFSIMDTLSKVPVLKNQIEKHSKRYVYLIENFTSKHFKKIVNKYCMIHIKRYLLRENKSDADLYEVIDSKIFKFDLLSDKKMFESNIDRDFIIENFPNYIENLKKFQISELLYKYRCNLMHEFRKPGYYLEDESDVPEYLQVNGEYELGFPVLFIENLTYNIIENLKRHCLDKNFNPYDAYEFGSDFIKN